MSQTVEERNEENKKMVSAMINAAPAVRGEPVAWLVTGPYEKAAFAYKETAEKYCAGLNMGYGEEAYKIRELYAAPQPAEQQPEPDVSALVEALELALEYWKDRQQRYKNRRPRWVADAESALAAHRQGDES